MSSQRPKRILPVLVFSQFAGTSLWFAGNAVLGPQAGTILLAAQFGFIAGTLVYGVLNIADRWPARAVFLISALLGAFANLGTAWFLDSREGLWTSRFFTGFFLAGVYPVGMKIAASWYREGLGRAQGYLVGALVVGTAFPHFLASFVVPGGAGSLPVGELVSGVSALAAIGAVLLFAAVPQGPVLPRSAKFEPRAFAIALRSKEFRGAALGYFGHMWELYAFWAFVPALIAAYASAHGETVNVSLWSFAVITSGAIGCIAGGLLSDRWGSARVAFGQLLFSGVCCALSSVFFESPLPVFMGFLFLWGSTVSGDSPQFTSLTARFAPREYVGSALTLVTCIGFSITLGSIQLLGWLLPRAGAQWMFLPLALGAVFGLAAGGREFVVRSKLASQPQL